MIDYENVGSDGLTGCDRLTKTDRIIIFFTKNAMKINMSDIANHGEAALEMIEVPAGKQSTDIHIGSYLGYLAGIYKGKACGAVVVSNDSDFDNVLEFWKARSGIKASRTPQIKAPEAKAAPTKKTASSRKSDGKNAEKSSGDAKAALNQTIMQTLGKAGLDSEIVGYVASTAAKNSGMKDSKQRTYRSIISRYGQEKGLNIYNYIKKEL